MAVSNFYFKGHNRYIVIAPASASTPAGFQLSTFEQNNNISTIINEISPHLVRDRNALIHARSLVMNAGVNVTLSARDITHKLSDIIGRNLLRVYLEMPKQQIQSSTEIASVGASSTNKKSPKASKGKQTSASVQSGTVTNHSPTEVSIDKQECRSDPVSMLSGEEILPLVDFELNGLMPLTWRRLYRSSKVGTNVGMGYGWRHNFCVQLDHQYQAPAKVGPKKPGKYWFELTDDEGRVHVFDSVKRGQTSIQLSTGWSLVHQADGRQVLIKPDDSHWAFVKQQVAGKDVWQLESISNHQGQYFQLYYDHQGRLTQITTGPKRGVLLFYNAQSNLLKVASYMLDNQGNKQVHQNLLASYQYDDAQALIAATDINGRVERYSYVKVKSADITSDSDHQYNPKSTTYLLQRRTRASGFSHHFAWDGQDHQAKCIEQWGDDDIYHYHFEYTALVHGVKSRCTDSLGHSETFIHNTQGLLTEHHNPNGSIIRHQYDAVGRKVATIDACDNKIQYNYNHQGQLLAVIQADGGTTRFEYNRLGQRIVTRDAIGRTAKRHYDATGRLLSETGFDGRPSHYQYNDAGQLTQKIDVNGVTHRYHWDRDGELLATQVGDALTRFSHDRLGRVNATINPQGLVTEFIRDNKGQIIESKSYPQDNQDKPEEAISHYYQYDDAGRIIRQRQQADVAGEQELSNDSEYIENIIDYDGLAQPRQQTFADGSWLKFFYDKERNLNRIERSDGAQYRIEYTPTEQPRTLIGFDGREQHYQYDANDKLVAVNDSDIRFVELKRDAMGRICQQSSHVKLEPSATSALLNTQNFYQYNPIGQITRAHNQHRTVQQHLDPQGRINRVLQSQWQLDYQYDDSGNRIGLTLPDGQQIDYQYNKNSQLSGISVTGNGPSKQCVQLAHYHYLPSGLLHKTIQGNQLELTRAYDSHSRLIEQTWRHAQNETRLFESRRYQYDKQHQLQRCESKLGNDSAVDGQSSEHIIHKPEVKQFSYNKISQLIRHSHTGVSGENPNIADNASNARQQYQWDAFGNPLQAIRASDIHNHTHTHTQDISSNHVSANETASSQSADTVRPNKNVNDVVVNNDRLMSMAGVDYRYDASGNQISQVGTGDKQQRSFNGLNQLVQINVNGKLTQYEYDALGRRSAKITELGRTDFIWDNHQLIGECTLGEYSWYINQPDTFTPVALIKAGQIYYYHLDQLGTPICLTDENAKIVWRSQQDVFGQTIESVDFEDKDFKDAVNEHTDVDYAGQQDKITNPIRFQGQYFDDESGLHYNRFRYYSPQQARFIHQDPIGLVGGINHYQYAPNHVNWVDPFGLSCKEGTATIIKIGHGSNMHFAIQVKTKFDTTKTHQHGGTEEDGTRTNTLIIGFDEEDFAGQSIEKTTIKLPNAVAASDLQRQLLREGDMALDRADWNPDNLDTPLYDPVNQSCLTHVFDILKAGGIENVPDNSDIEDRKVKVFTHKLMKGKIAPPEKTTLEKHVEAVAAYKKHYEKRLADSIAAGDSARRQGAFKAKITEAKGELAASMHMEKEFSEPPPPATMEMGFGPGPGVDQVWAKRDENGKVIEYFVVEAKGPGAKLLTGAKKGDQMTERWVKKSLESMADSKKYKEKNQLGEDILDAIENKKPKVTKLVIEADEVNGKIVGGKLQTLPKEKKNVKIK